MEAIRAAKVWRGDGFADDVAVVIEAGVIREVTASASLAPATPVSDEWVTVDEPVPVLSYLDQVGDIDPEALDGEVEPLHGLELSPAERAFADEVRKFVAAELAAILTPIRERAQGLVANFGVSDAALLDVLTGRAAFAGKLPFELPSSMEAVVAQRSDVAHDSANPLYPLGFGLRY